MAVDPDDRAHLADASADDVGTARANRELAHDLRNIFSVINLCAVDLHHEMQGRQALTLVMEVLHAAERGLSVATELLQADHEVTAPIRPTDLRVHVMQLQSFLGRLVGAGVDTEFVVGDVPLFTAVDRTSATQLLMNLVSNASEAVRGGGVVRVSTHVDGDEAVLTISDDGPGAPATVRDHMFDEGWSTKDGAHWGLGLAIVRRVVARCGGTISAAPALPSGLSVTVRFPLLEPTRSGLALVVAADDASRRTIAGALDRAGFTVLAASDPLEACDLVVGRDVADIAFVDHAGADDPGLWQLARLGDVPRRALLDDVVLADEEADRLVVACTAPSLMAPQPFVDAELRR